MGCFVFLEGHDARPAVFYGKVVVGKDDGAEFRLQVVLYAPVQLKFCGGFACEVKITAAAEQYAAVQFTEIEYPWSK